MGTFGWCGRLNGYSQIADVSKATVTQSYEAVCVAGSGEIPSTLDRVEIANGLFWLQRLIFQRWHLLGRAVMYIFRIRNRCLFLGF